LNLTFFATVKTYLIYATGISATIVIIALVALFSQATLRRIKNSMRVIEIISSIFLILVGLYLIVFGLYETQYSNLVSPFHDLITSIFRIQGKIVDAVNSILVKTGIL
jgi:ABC-type nickel/cobalt efflux system permease component RcnA